MILEPSKLETHDIGTLNVNAIVNADWKQLNDIFGNTGAGAGILATAVAGAGYPNSSEVVTKTGTQTLTNKTLTSPVLTTPALGTPASGNLSNCTVDGTNPVGNVTLTGTQTLTNKTLTSPTFTGPVLGTPASGNLSSCTADGTSPVGRKIWPVVAITADFTLALTDIETTRFHDASDTTAREIEIPNNSVVAFPVGSEIRFLNEEGAGDLRVFATTDTLTPPDGPDVEAQSVHIVGQGMIILIKVATTKWIGVGYNMF